MVFLKKDLMQVDMKTGDLQEGMVVLVPQKSRLRGDFMLLMLEALERLARDKDIGGVEYRVLFFLIGHVQYENYIEISQTYIAKELELKQPNVSRAIRKLLDKNILIEERKKGRSKVYRLNAFYGWKGRINREYQEAFEEHSKLVS